MLLFIYFKHWPRHFPCRGRNQILGQARDLLVEKIPYLDFFLFVFKFLAFSFDWLHCLQRYFVFQFGWSRGLTVFFLRLLLPVLFCNIQGHQWSRSEDWWLCTRVRRCIRERETVGKMPFCKRDMELYIPVIWPPPAGKKKDLLHNYCENRFKKRLWLLPLSCWRTKW